MEDCRKNLVAKPVEEYKKTMPPKHGHLLTTRKQDTERKRGMAHGGQHRRSGCEDMLELCKGLQTLSGPKQRELLVAHAWNTNIIII